MKREDFEKICPKWKRWNRESHFRKHGEEVAFALNRPTVEFDQWDYEEASLRSVHKAVMYFEAQHLNRENNQFNESRSYFVDRRLLQAITDISTSNFISYYQVNFYRTVSQSAIKEMTDGDRLLRFQTKIKREEDGGLLVQVRRKHGFTPFTT